MRVFTAIPLPESVRERIILQTAALRGRYPDLRWVRQEALHITLNFIGEVEEERIEELRQALQLLKGRAEAFPLSFRGLGTFPKRGPARVLYLAVDEGAERTVHIQKELARGLQHLAGKERKRFTPHLTLARVKNSADYPDPQREGSEIGADFSVERVVLYRSHLQPDGARYEELDELRLSD
jgi:2'-5' RNA ligase